MVRRKWNAFFTLATFKSITQSPGNVAVAALHTIVCQLDKQNLGKTNRVSGVPDWVYNYVYPRHSAIVAQSLPRAGKSMWRKDDRNCETNRKIVKV